MQLEHFPSEEGIGRVLFFGRQNCEGTKKALSILKSAGFSVDYIESRQKGERIPQEAYLWQGEYIFCYRSFFILDSEVIDRASVAAINFHPGPPEYPGSGCINFALYDGASNYGVTAHYINEKVDNGTILRCIRFPILKEDDIKSLLQRTHHSLTFLFFEIISGIAERGEHFLKEELTAAKAEKWRGDARKMSEFYKLQTIDTHITEAELDRRVRAAHMREYPVHLYLYDRKFVLDED